MSIVIYGIKSCDTMKKAFTWLDQQGLDYQFHDYKKAGAPEPEQLANWISELGWENVINRRGTTWRKLPEQRRQNMDADDAIRAAIENPSMIKRPLLEYDNGLLLGFSPEQWQEKLA